MVKKLATTLLFLCLASSLVFSAQPYERLWEQILKETVQNKRKDRIHTALVDYKHIQNSQTFSSLLRFIAQFDPNTLETLDDKKAFWINMYNIAAVNLIIKHYPVSSIKDLSNILHPVWNKPAINIYNKNYTLDEIENLILRPMGDARIHFAIVCASISCPNLAAFAYNAETLNIQLEKQTVLFLSNNTKGIKFKHGTKEMHVSKIFKWFEDDFKTKETPSVQAFITQKLGRNVDDYKIYYLDYKWGLNQK